MRTLEVVMYAVSLPGSCLIATMAVAKDPRSPSSSFIACVQIVVVLASSVVVVHSAGGFGRIPHGTARNTSLLECLMAKKHCTHGRKVLHLNRRHPSD